MANTQDSRAQFEKWCARKWGVVSSFVKGRYLDLDDQDRWEAYAAGTADARAEENEAWGEIGKYVGTAFDCLPSNVAGASFELRRVLAALRAQQGQGKETP